MNNKNNDTVRLSFLSAVLMVLALTSCGGDDGGSSLGGVSIPTEEIAITSSNVALVTTESTEVTDRTDTASSVIDESNNTNSDLSARVAQKASILVSDLARRSNRSKGNISARAAQNCPNGGTFTSPDTTTGIGDYVYNNCAFDQFTVNGSISIQGTGDLIAGTSFTGSYSYNELTITTADDTSIFDGTMKIDFSDTGSVIQGTYEIPSLTYVFGNEGVKISNYILTFYDDAAGGNFEYNYTISSTILGGSVSVETIERFYYYNDIDYDYYPYAGKLVIKGADNTSAQLTVEAGGTGLAEDYVIIEIDADGDTIYEESRRVQWADL